VSAPSIVADSARLRAIRVAAGGRSGVRAAAMRLIIRHRRIGEIGMSRPLVVLALMLLCVAVRAQPAVVPGAPTTLAAAARVATPFDPVAATRTYVDRVQGDARARSDAYSEGGYWLLLWDLVYGLAVAWLLLSRRISTRLREFAERRTRRPNLRTLVYALAYVPLTAVLGLPLAFYAGFYREHQYGLSNLSFAGWLGETGMGVGVNMVVAGIAITGLYAFLRRFPRTWWAWGALAGCGAMVVLFMVAPVFIAPLFNTYKPVPDGPVRDQILSLARANGIPAGDVYYFDASKQTKRVSANVSGLFGTTRISLNDNLLNGSSPAQIRAVMAHEMGHYVLNHGPKDVVAFSLLLLGGLLFMRFGWDRAAPRFAARFGVQGIADPAGLPLLAALFSVYTFLATPVINTIIRTAEVEADIFGLNASREPDGMAEVMLKLSEYRKLEPGPIEEFVFFDHPSGYRRILMAMRWKAENAR
jgi:STE24 endopeptidase